ncbi:unnamed protein product [Toxocara canis]|uniref:Transposase n=1 Tax=Toxocara canis TaxID=6265 RepID=A0A183UPB5_TOXCA|nr:unnamed protein product [Toxocara canis]
MGPAFLNADQLLAAVTQSAVSTPQMSKFYWYQSIGTKVIPQGRFVKPEGVHTKRYVLIGLGISVWYAARLIFDSIAVADLLGKLGGGVAPVISNQSSPAQLLNASLLDAN